jgi:hypothetical protein
MTNNQVVVVNQGDEMSFGFVPLMVVCGVVALIINYFWPILIVSSLLVAASLLWRASILERRRAAVLAARAERQDRQFLAGDERGVFGEGLEPR